MQKSNYEIFILILSVLGLLLDSYILANIFKLMNQSDDIIVMVAVLLLSSLIFFNVLFFKFIIKQLSK